MPFTIEIQGLDALTKKFDTLAGGAIDAAAQTGLEKSAVVTEKLLKSNTPVDTGALKESTRIEISPGQAAIGPDETKLPHYAPDVEFGHHTRSGSFVPGQHYIQKTAIQSGPITNEIIQGEINKAIKNAR